MRIYYKTDEDRLEKEKELKAKHYKNVGEYHWLQVYYCGKIEVGAEVFLLPEHYKAIYESRRKKRKKPYMQN